MKNKHLKSHDLKGLFLKLESVSELLFSSDNKYVSVACDKHVKVFYNITGLKVFIKDTEEKLRTAKTQGTKERLQQLIADNKFLIEFRKKKYLKFKNLKFNFSKKKNRSNRKKRRLNTIFLNRIFICDISFFSFSFLPNKITFKS